MMVKEMHSVNLTNTYRLYILSALAGGPHVVSDVAFCIYKSNNS